jgi:hypothetical protein
MFSSRCFACAHRSIPGAQLLNATIAAADEQAKIDAWIAASGLNKYGDAQGTMYAGKLMPSIPDFDPLQSS